MFLRYTTVSLLATSLDFAVFYAFGFFGKNLPGGMAALLSAGCGAWVSWTLNARWVFVRSEVGRRAAGGRYFAGVLLCIALNALAVLLLCDVLAWPRMLGRTVAAGTVWAVMYWFNRRVVFRV